MCPTTATVSPFLPDFHPATTRPPAAPAATLPKQGKSRGNEVDIRDHRQMVGSIKPDVKAILPEPRSVQKAISYQYQRIDPLGFAFDNYDAVGQWPTEERVTAGKGANPPVNANGKLADGRAYDGPDTFKQLLVQDLDRFAEAFVEQLATFALRRAMTLDDASALKNIALTARKDNYKLLPILEALVSSELFQKR